MQGKSLIHRWRATVLGIVLCLLAAVFSFEAKIAWYSPAPAHTEISAAKLRPSEAGRLVIQALVAKSVGSAVYSAPPHSQLPWLAVFALPAAAAGPICRINSNLNQASTSPGFSPFRFSRPPPTR
jgi:hypothetical protein